MRASDLAKTIELVYQAAVEPQAWTAFLRSAAERFDACIPGMEFVKNRSGGDGHKLTLDCDESLVAAYDTHYFRSVHAILFASGLEGNACTYRDAFAAVHGDHAPYHEWDFQAEWMAPQGLDDCLGVFGAREGHHYGLGLYKRLGRAPFSTEDRRALDALAPHIVRALSVRDRFLGLRHERDVARAALDQLHFGVVLISEGGRLIGMNATAEALCSAGDGLREDRETGVAPADPRQRTRLRRQVAAAVGGWRRGTGAPPDAVRVARPSGEEAYELLVARLPLDRFETPGGGHAAVAIFVSDPMDRRLPRERLEQLFSLTPAEADVAASVAAGDSIARLASRRGVATETVRNQLKVVFSKTGAHTQRELASRLLSGVAAIGRSRGSFGDGPGDDDSEAE